MDLSLQQVIFRLGALLLIAPVHGAAIAVAAGLLGDPGPRYDGRRTLAPAPHLDLVGGLVLIVFGFGWIRPTAIDPGLLRFGRFGLVLAALTGLAASLAFAGLLEALRRPLILSASGNFPLHGVAFLDTASRLSLAFVLLNALPLPPFTGGLLLAALRPASAAALARHRLGFTLLAAAFVASGLAERVLRPLAQLLPGA